MVNCSPNFDGQRGSMDSTKEWQMEMLMEKLRSKATQYRSFFECAKALRMVMVEKRYTIDSVERGHLQKCLDTLQQNMKVTTHQAMVERLESVSRQLGLKCVNGPSSSDLFISSDMFYLEVQLDPSGGVKDVKIHHEGRDQQPQSCEELVECLSRRDFVDFTLQLEGLSSIYQLNAEKKMKAKAYTALTSLETDLALISSIHSYIKDPHSVVHHTPLGYLEKRRGGHAMRLTYFIPPYELVDVKQRCMRPLVLEPGFNLGFSVSVCFESSTAHKLQTSPLATISRNSSVSCEVYSSVTSTNSMTVAGCFVLTLNKPMPICTGIVDCIQEVTKCQISDLSTTHPILSLVTQNSTDPHTCHQATKGLFVNIGDQTHCYLMTENKDLRGVMVSSISFTHPSHVPKIIGYLRQQALFNTVVASCVRPNARQDIEKMIMLEVTPLTWQHLSISLEHPLGDCMATVELDLRDMSNLSCKVYTSSSENTSANSEYATKVFQKSVSIPVTLRSLIRLWNVQAQRMSGFYNGVLGGGGGDGSGGGGGGSASHGELEFDPDVKVKLEPGVGGLGGGGFTGGGGGKGAGPFDCEEEEDEEEEEEEAGEEERRSRKRKRKDRDGWQSPKSSRYDDSLDGQDSSSCESTSLGTPASSNTNTLDFPPSSDLSELVEKPIELDPEPVEETEFKAKKKQRREEKTGKTAADIILDLENKNLVPPSVSITPISSTQFTSPSYSVLSEMGLERRPGIEIIPLPSAAATPLPSSITITPIPSSGSSTKSDERKSEKKSSKSKSDRLKLEKKKKRKREDSPSMGPPEKIPSKSSSSDPLNKPVSVSIKPAESLSPRPSSPANVSRKYSSSPTHTSPLALSAPPGKSSPTPSSKSIKASPKHSPAYSTSSPKNSLTSSPKHGTSSPKHQSTSGKPSLSALKSAVTSPSKSDGKVKSKEGKDRDKKSSSSSSGYPSPKSKSSSSSSSSSSGSNSSSSSIKVKQIDLSSSAVESNTTTVPNRGSVSPSSDESKSSSSNPAQIKNRKGSLSAVIDKLKLAHHASDEQPKDKRDSKERVSSSSSSSGSSSSTKVDSKLLKPGENKSGEYSVKQSSDGIKLTINKTKSKESSKSKSGSSSDLSKSHTSLKPGTNSGPGSKKISHSSQKSSTSIKSSSSTSSKSNIKSSSSSSSSLKSSVKSLSGSPKSSESRNKDKNRVTKDRSIFSSSKADSRKMSPSGVREDSSEYKSFSGISISPQLSETGKTLDRNYQIPKLSSRESGDKKRERTDSPKTESSRDKYSSSKNEDGRGGGESKSKSYYSSSDKTGSKPHLHVDLSDSPTISIIPVPPRDDRDKGGGVEDILNSIKMDLPIASTISLTPLNQDNKEPEVTTKEVSDLLLDLTGVKPPRKGTPPLFPGSPSVSVHIVKSPAPTSPLVMTSTSPHSASPTCIDDDELMDEALVGITK